MQYTRYWQVTRDTISEIWLNGFTRSREPAKELAALARSWLQAPKLRLLSRTGAVAYGYDLGARAYLLDTRSAAAPKELQLALAASVDSPVVNPTFLVNHWGSRSAELEVNGVAIPRGRDFRTGHYRTLDIEDGREWSDVLIVWAKISSTKPVRLTIRPAGRSAPAERGEPYRIWKSIRGTSVEARLVEDAGETVTLQRRTGQKLRVKRTYLSPEDRRYLDKMHSQPRTVREEQGGAR